MIRGNPVYDSLEISEDWTTDTMIGRDGNAAARSDNPHILTSVKGERSYSIDYSSHSKL